MLVFPRMSLISSQLLLLFPAASGLVLVGTAREYGLWPTKDLALSRSTI